MSRVTENIFYVTYFEAICPFSVMDTEKVPKAGTLIRTEHIIG